MNDLLGLRALITGSGRRVGGALALALAKAGCDVAVHYHLNSSAAHKTVAEICKLGRRSKAFQADLRTLDGVAALSKAAEDFLGGVDILIHAASTYPDPERVESNHSFLEETAQAFDESIAVNARAPFFLTQFLAPALRASRKGNVISLLDQSISAPFRSRAAHSVSKSALRAVTNVIADALGPAVRVNALELGLILPGDGMEGADAWEWAGVEPVIEAVLEILRDSRYHNQLTQVGVPEGTTHSSYERSEK